jgi:Tol biopolymer transport system component
LESGPVPDDRWQRVKDLIGGALERPPAMREAYLREACGEDHALRRDVESLLAARREAGEFLSEPARLGEAAPPPLALSPGHMLGRYEIVSLLGAGGMGEVYRARDSRLGRDVAIKVLPDAFVQDPDRLTRFEREARLLASLNHPNIASIHGFEEADGTRFLIMELVPGETLAERLQGGPLPAKDALSLARQIAEALEEAHEKGIVHRDLKPANVKMTAGGKVKVLDFGLAKALGAEPKSSDIAQSPTLTRTGAAILGTAAYMSPEQARGKAVDKRTDVWAFGCVLYEMLTGRPAFGGETASDVIAAILKHEPDWALLPTQAPAKVADLLHRCLQKDPHERLHDIADARIELEEATTVVSTGSALVAPQRLRRGATNRERIAWAVAAAAAIALVAEVSRRPPPEAAPPLRKFAVSPPEGARLAVGEAPALSPDGRRLVFVGTDSTGRRMLCVRAFDQLEARPLAGTEGVAWAGLPFWSPDGQWIGFFADGQLKKIALDGGPPLSLAQAVDSRGGAWSSTGIILFAPSLNSPLYGVSDQGGAVTQATSLDASRQEVSHRLPSFLPDGESFLFLVQAGAPQNHGLYLGTLGSRTTTRVGDIQSKAVFVSPYLFYTRGAALVAQRFDPARKKLSGDPRPIAEGVAGRIGIFGERAFSAARDGTVAYWTGGSSFAELAWFDRNGKKQDVLGEPGLYDSLRLSPDGTRVAFEFWDPETGPAIWVHDLKRGVRSPYSVRSAADWGPAWSPGGDRLVYGSLRRGYSSIFERAYPGGGEEDELLLDTGHFIGPTDWSADGRLIVFVDYSAADVGILPIGGTPRLVLSSKFGEKDGRLSPDGHWLAFTSNESGMWQVWLQSFPEPRTRLQVSTQGGSHPEWEPSSGKELFYVAPEGTLMAVTIGGDSLDKLETPHPLFRAEVVGHPFKRSYSVAPAGQRFLMIVSREKESLAPIAVITNWTPEARR